MRNSNRVPSSVNVAVVLGQGETARAAVAAVDLFHLRRPGCHHRRRTERGAADRVAVAKPFLAGIAHMEVDHFGTVQHGDAVEAHVGNAQSVRPGEHVVQPLAVSFQRVDLVAVLVENLFDLDQFLGSSWVGRPALKSPSAVQRRPTSWRSVKSTMAQSARSPTIKVGATHRCLDSSHALLLSAVLTLGMVTSVGVKPSSVAASGALSAICCASSANAGGSSGYTSCMCWTSSTVPLISQSYPSFPT